MADAPEMADAPGMAMAPPRRHRAALLAAVALAAILGAVGVASWPRGSAFTYGNGMGMTTSVGTTWVVNMGAAHADVEVRAATPRLGPGSPLVTTRVLRCVTSNPYRTLGLAEWDPTSQHCPSMERVEGPMQSWPGRPGEPDGSAYLILLVTPLEAGTVTIDGIDVDYSRGWVDRTERSGVRFELEVTN